MAVSSSSLFCLCDCLSSEIDILHSMDWGPSQLRVKRKGIFMIVTINNQSLSLTIREMQSLDEPVNGIGGEN